MSAAVDGEWAAREPEPSGWDFDALASLWGAGAGLAAVTHVDRKGSMRAYEVLPADEAVRIAAGGCGDPRCVLHTIIVRDDKGRITAKTIRTQQNSQE